VGRKEKSITGGGEKKKMNRLKMSKWGPGAETKKPRAPKGTNKQGSSLNKKRSSGKRTSGKDLQTRPTSKEKKREGGIHSDLAPQDHTKGNPGKGGAVQKLAKAGE